MYISWHRCLACNYDCTVEPVYDGHCIYKAATSLKQPASLVPNSTDIAKTLQSTPVEQPPSGKDCRILMCVTGKIHITAIINHCMQWQTLGGSEAPHSPLPTPTPHACTHFPWPGTNYSKLAIPVKHDFCSTSACMLYTYCKRSNTLKLYGSF